MSLAVLPRLQIFLLYVTQQMNLALSFWQAFRQCDMDNSGRIDVKELHIGLLILYDKINSLLPMHHPIPSKREVWTYNLA